jgi:nucleoside-diphosphate-sugar epimerase
MNSPPNKYLPAKKQLLVIGYGDLAERLCGNLSDAEWEVHGLCRRVKKSDSARLVSGDAKDEKLLDALLRAQPDQILVTLTPDRRDEAGYEETYLKSVQALISSCLRCRVNPHLIFVSSTAVYGRDDGGTVSEGSTADARQFNGRVLRQTERLLEASSFPFTIVRLSGIYGRNAEPLAEQLRSQRASFRPMRWTNRIHVRDVIGVLRFVLEDYKNTGRPLGVLLVSDLRPVQEGAKENWLRAQLGLPRLSYVGSPAQTGKKCQGVRLSELGYKVEVPDFRVGYVVGR